jgi:hypothetical protein
MVDSVCVFLLSLNKYTEYTFLPEPFVASSNIHFLALRAIICEFHASVNI